jgi:hypothetical protein
MGLREQYSIYANRLLDAPPYPLPSLSLPTTPICTMVPMKVFILEQMCVNSKLLIDNRLLPTGIRLL